MSYALFSVGLLGLLVFLLGFNVSRARRSVLLTQDQAEADPKSQLRKAMRAQGNCIEYVPMLALLILALGQLNPVPSVFLASLMIAAVVSRYLHAAGIIFGGSIYSPTALKFCGALGTYLTGIALSVMTIIESARLLG